MDRYIIYREKCSEEGETYLVAISTINQSYISQLKIVLEYINFNSCSKNHFDIIDNITFTKEELLKIEQILPTTYYLEELSIVDKYFDSVKFNNMIVCYNDCLIKETTNNEDEEFLEKIDSLEEVFVKLGIHDLF